MEKLDIFCEIFVKKSKNYMHMELFKYFKTLLKN